jgi:hypothetical protein
MKKYLILVAILSIGKISKGQEISRTFYPSQLKEEISVLKEALTTLHPGLYKYNTKQQIEKLFTGLNNKTTKPLNEKDFYLLLAKLSILPIKLAARNVNRVKIPENVVLCLIKNN